MTSALIISIYIAEFIALAFGAFIGYRLGLFRSIVRTIYLIILIPISLVLANIISHPIVNSIIKFLSNINNSTIKALADSSPETFAFIGAIITPFISLALFAIFFALLELLTLIKFKYISDKITAPISANTTNSTTNKWGGLGIGILNGALSATVLLIPLCIATSVLSSSDYSSTWETLKFDEYIAVRAEEENAVTYNEMSHFSVSKCLSLNVLNTKSNTIIIPSNWLLPMLTSVGSQTLPEEYSVMISDDLCMIDEAPYLLNAIIQFLNAHSEAVDQHKTSSSAIFRALGAANEASGESRVIPVMFTEVLVHAAQAWARGETFLGIDLQTSNEFTSAMISKALDTLQQATPENIHSIVRTLMGNGHEDGVMPNILILKSQISSDQTSTTTIKNNDKMIADTLIQLGKDEDLQSINDVMDEMGTEYIQNTGTQFFNNEIYDDEKKQAFDILKETIIQCLKQSCSDSDNNYEARVHALAATIRETSASYNHEISAAESTILAVGLISHFESQEEITLTSVLEYFGFSSNEIDSIINVKK